MGGAQTGKGPGRSEWEELRPGQERGGGEGWLGREKAEGIGGAKRVKEEEPKAPGGGDGRSWGRG